MKLQADDLAPETLRAGESIEYYSMAFVAGDPRGLRVARILQIRPEDHEFPLRLDSQEMLPRTMMIKRKLDRRGEEIPSTDAVWRKIRTFAVRAGKVAGKTRADRLNEGLKTCIQDAMESVNAQMSKKRKRDEMGRSSKLPLDAADSPRLDNRVPPRKAKQTSITQSFSRVNDGESTRKGKYFTSQSSPQMPPRVRPPADRKQLLRYIEQLRVTQKKSKDVNAHMALEKQIKSLTEEYKQLRAAVKENRKGSPSQHGSSASPKHKKRNHNAGKASSVDDFDRLLSESVLSCEPRPQKSLSKSKPTNSSNDSVSFYMGGSSDKAISAHRTSPTPSRMTPGKEAKTGTKAAKKDKQRGGRSPDNRKSQSQIPGNWIKVKRKNQ